MLIDDVTIEVIAGNGGRGKVAFNSNKMSLGPTGGRGGNGGSVYLDGASNLDLLNQMRFKKELKAADGQNGKAQYNDGNKGDDLIIKVPVGTVIHNLDTGVDEEITKVDQRVLVAKGGHGGKGNFLFRGPHNTSPTRFQEGLPGEKFTLRLELKLIADIGFVGLPNVGKSSLLNELTNAKSKVANYQFTTLEPNLGVYYGMMLADIPGLIEGASSGKGLGIKFLRHIERTKILFHFVSAQSEDLMLDYKTIRKELGEYSEELLKKPEHLFISKSDEVSPEELEKKIKILKKVNKKVLAISIYDMDSIKAVQKILNGLAE
ncbi:MAG: GTPase ObgE [Candidatus Yanofskybacteria bacterium CG10_big_fil_rev_8_21_14_0_10_36_16]|uniref:GTPase Obg n=1 Tax=Candidatus Yanofskybacteria bacterium CG10_big_fil_rev_8_21_14_0_10_36_16 TaxID=1975096 RepID=A0A2J0Q770_9BACT|nr:MAG: GTPase ObgE [Candidatus Yanofskybacteria bacterium CG10_big_fil_rev_8_21_14_0_10_36_16]